MRIFPQPSAFFIRTALGFFSLLLVGCRSSTPRVGKDFPDQFRAVSSKVSPWVVSLEVYASHADQPTTLGSAFVFRHDGIIGTSAHVLTEAGQIRVLLPSGRSLPAYPLAQDIPSDLALLKVDANLPEAQWGDSGTAAQGDLVFAFGAPFGLRGSMSIGIISARRYLPEMGDYPEVLQTDVPVEPGSSGGVLVDPQGRIVGMICAIDSDAPRGVGFAIPGNRVHSGMTELLRQGQLDRGHLGIMLPEKVDPQTFSFLGLPRDSAGVLLAGIEEGSSAARAGLQRDDLLESFNGETIPDQLWLREKIVETVPGTPVSVVFRRRAVSQSVKIAIDSAPSAAKSLVASEFTHRSFWIGGGALTGTSLQSWSSDEKPEEPIITSVNPSSVAAQAGVDLGDAVVLLLTSSGTLPANPQTTGVLAPKDTVLLIRRGKTYLYLHLNA